MPKKAEEARRKLQKLEDHRAMQPGKGQVMFPLPTHCSPLSAMVFPPSLGVSRGQRSPNDLVYLGPHPKTVHIPTGKPQKHSVPTGKVTSYSNLDGYLRSWLCFLRNSGAKVRFSGADSPLIKRDASSTLQLKPRKGFCSRSFTRVKLLQVAVIILFYRWDRWMDNRDKQVQHLAV